MKFRVTVEFDLETTEYFGCPPHAAGVRALVKNIIKHRADWPSGVKTVTAVAADKQKANTDDDIQKAFEANGVQFTNRSFGRVSTKTVTADCLIKTVRDLERK